MRPRDLKNEKEVFFMSKKGYKKLAALILCLGLLSGTFDSVIGIGRYTIEAQAAGGATLEDLQSKFPNGKYWNHYVATDSDRTVGLSGDFYSDSVTDHPCNTHNGICPIGGYDCNKFNGIQCNGFVRKISTEVYGSVCMNWGTTSLDNVKAGDVLHYVNSETDKTYGHWVMIIGVNGNTLTVGEANAYGNCKISWGRTIDKTAIWNTKLYSAPYTLPPGGEPPSPSQTLTISANEKYQTTDDITISWNSITGAEKYGLSVWKPPYDGDANLVFDEFVYGTSHNIGKLPAGTYRCKMASWSNGKMGLKSNEIYFEVEEADTEKPVISNVVVSDVSTLGYTITCTVTDNTGIDRVQFPTWTLKNDQDDIQLDWGTSEKARGTINGNTVTFRVNDSEHNYEKGTYITHIYAYDTFGNYSIAQMKVNVENQYIPINSATYKGNTYIAFDDNLSCEEARQKCLELGGHLATIISADENAIVAKLIQNGGRTHYWLGATKVNDKWYWETNETFNYNNWAVGEPNNFGGVENRCEINKKGAWNDSCYTDNTRGFICEIEAVSEPTATLIPTVTAKPTATTSPTVTASPTATPIPTATAKPTATPRPTATLKPTATPSLTATPKPTATPRPIVTAKPMVSVTLSPTATSKPTTTLKVTEKPKLTPAQETIQKATPKPAKVVKAPSKPVIKSVTNVKGKKMVVKLKAKVKGAKGYQLTYATNSRFTQAKKSVDMKSTSKTITKLKKGKTYYVKVRAYVRDTKGKNVYGKYSNVKKVKIQK